jgi:antitoxin component YwqK of YwqJK toxin-antitoxin module
MRLITFFIMLCLTTHVVAAEDIACPKGTIQNGAEAPGVTEAWCELETDRSQLHGPYRSWYGNGILGTMENYNHGKRDGKAEYRWGNGKLQASGQYKNGVREGAWIFFEVSGTSPIHVRYRHGKPVSGHEPGWVTERNASSE